MANILSLPTEIRLEIYTHIFSWSLTSKSGADEYDLKARQRSLDCGVCRLGFRTNRENKKLYGRRGVRPEVGTSGLPAVIYRRPGSTPNITAIMRTCKLIHREAQDALYNRTLFVITHQYTDNAAEPWMCLRKNQDPWTEIGHSTELAQTLLGRASNIAIEYFIDTGIAGIALPAKLRLLQNVMASLSPERRYTDVELTFSVPVHSLHWAPPWSYKNGKAWDEFTDVVRQIEFGCIPPVQCVTWRSDVQGSQFMKDYGQKLEQAMNLEEGSVKGWNT